MTARTRDSGVQEVKSFCEKIPDNTVEKAVSTYGYFFDFHITLSSDVTFIESHVITEDVELKIKERYLADVVIHTDPDVLPERNNSLFSRRGTQLNPL